MFRFRPVEYAFWTNHRHFTKHLVPYWLSDLVIVEAFGEEVSGRSNDHIVHYFTNLLLTGRFYS
jgi:hypothetical protein